jgi:hypothetical protein
MGADLRAQDLTGAALYGADLIRSFAAGSPTLSRTHAPDMVSAKGTGERTREIAVLRVPLPAGTPSGMTRSNAVR